MILICPYRRTCLTVYTLYLMVAGSNLFFSSNHFWLRPYFLYFGRSFVKMGSMYRFRSKYRNGANPNNIIISIAYICAKTELIVINIIYWFSGLVEFWWTWRGILWNLHFFENYWKFPTLDENLAKMSKMWAEDRIWGKNSNFGIWNFWKYFGQKSNNNSVKCSICRISSPNPEEFFFHLNTSGHKNFCNQAKRWMSGSWQKSEIDKFGKTKWNIFSISLL